VGLLAWTQAHALLQRDRYFSREIKYGRINKYGKKHVFEGNRADWGMLFHHSVGGECCLPVLERLIHPNAQGVDARLRIFSGMLVWYREI